MRAMERKQYERGTRPHTRLATNTSDISVDKSQRKGKQERQKCFLSTPFFFNYLLFTEGDEGFVLKKGEKKSKL